MTAYYNEFDPFAAEWLRALIAAGHIAPGDVDTRSIVDVRPDDLKGYTQCHFFAGIGGWSYAARLAGWPDDKPLWSGSCPCQPLSSAGNQRGHLDERHLWPAFFSLISERRPSICFGEQVTGADGLAWLSAVRLDLEECGYAVGAANLCAFAAGAPHQRQRLYWVADANSDGRAGIKKLDEQPAAWIETSRRHDLNRRGGDFWSAAELMEGANNSRRLLAPGIKLLADGLSEGVGQLRAYGNAIVPQVAQTFIEAYLDVRHLRLTNLSGFTTDNTTQEDIFS